MGIQERKAREKTELRNKILNASKKIFIEEGYENISMRKISEKIEYSATTIYLYFSSKDDLLYALLEEYNSDFFKKWEIINSKTEDNLTKLKEYLLLYIRHGLENPEMFKILTHFFSEKRSENNKHKQSTSYDLLNELIKNTYLKESSHNTDLILQSLWALSFGLTSLIILRPSFSWIDKEELINTAIEMQIKGFSNLEYC